MSVVVAATVAIDVTAVAFVVFTAAAAALVVIAAFVVATYRKGLVGFS